MQENIVLHSLFSIRDIPFFPWVYWSLSIWYADNSRKIVSRGSSRRYKCETMIISHTWEIRMILFESYFWTFGKLLDAWETWILIGEVFCPTRFRYLRLFKSEIYVALKSYMRNPIIIIIIISSKMAALATSQVAKPTRIKNLRDCELASGIF